MTKVTVVGAGFIGRGWAIVFARAGHDVRVFDAVPAAIAEALVAIRRSVEALEQAGLLSDSSGILGRIHGARRLEDALSDSDWVQENVPERIDAKIQLFRALDLAAPPHAVLASSTSSLPPSQFLAELSGRDRCIVAHPFNPPHVVPVVELVKTPWLADEFIERCRAFLAGCGQVPVVLSREIFGFAFNRLQTALVNEAVHLVQEGIISAEDLDRCVREGLGLRWAFLGPFETMDLNAPGGFSDYASKFGGGYQALGAQLRTADPWRPETMRQIERELRQRYGAHDLIERQLWRDRMVLRLRQLVGS